MLHAPNRNEQIRDYQDHIIDIVTDDDLKLKRIVWKPTMVPLKQFNKGDDNTKLKAYCRLNNFDYDSLTQYMNHE